MNDLDTCIHSILTYNIVQITQMSTFISQNGQGIAHHTFIRLNFSLEIQL